MGFFDSLVGRDTSRSKALALYKRGMEKAKKQNHQGAIDDYSAAIDLSEGPADVRAMAIYNRALVYAAAKDNSKAVDDLKRLLELPETPANVKTAAGEKLKRLNRRIDKGGA